MRSFRLATNSATRMTRAENTTELMAHVLILCAIPMLMLATFAVEKTGYTRPGNLKGKAGSTVTFDGRVLKFPTWTTKEPLEQGERQAQCLSNG